MEKTHYEVKKYEMFGVRLKAQMKAQGIDRYLLSDILCVTPSTIAGYCSGRRSPSVVMLAELARALGTTSDYLIGLTEYNGE